MSGTVLLVENQREEADALERALKFSNVAVHRVSSGEEAEEIARTKSFSAILTAIDLPRMNGFSLCQRLRQNDGLTTTPIILMGTTDVRLELVQGDPWRATAYYKKPIDVQHVVKEILNIIDADDFEELDVDLDSVLEMLDDDIELAEPAPAPSSNPFDSIDADDDFLDDLFNDDSRLSSSDGLSILSDLSSIEDELKERLSRPTGQSPAVDRNSDTVQISRDETFAPEENLKDTQDVPILDDDDLILEEADLEQILDDTSTLTISNDILMEVPEDEAAGVDLSEVTAVDNIENIRYAAESSRAAQGLDDQAGFQSSAAHEREIARLKAELAEAQAGRQREADAAASAIAEAARLKGARDESSEALQEVWKKVEEHKAAEAALEAELTELRGARAAEAGEAAAELNAQLNELKADLEQARAEAADAAKALDELAAEQASSAEASQAAADQALESSDKLQRDLDELSQQLEKLKADYEAAVEDRDKFSAEADQNAKELKIQIERAASRDDAIASLEQQLAESTKASAGPSARDILALRESINAKDRELLGLRDDALRKEHAVLEAQEALAKAEAAHLTKYEELESALANERGELASANDKLAASASALEELQAKAEELEAAQVKSAEELAAAQAASEESQEALKAELAAAEEASLKLTQELEAAVAYRQSLEDKISELEDEVRATASRLQEADDAREQAAEESAKLSSEQAAAIESANEKISALEAERDDLTAQLEERSAELAALRGEFAQRSGDLGALIEQSAEVAREWRDWSSAIKERSDSLDEIIEAVMNAVSVASPASSVPERPSSDPEAALARLAELNSGQGPELNSIEDQGVDPGEEAAPPPLDADTGAQEGADGEAVEEQAGSD